MKKRTLFSRVVYSYDDKLIRIIDRWGSIHWLVEIADYPKFDDYDDDDLDFTRCVLTSLDLFRVYGPFDYLNPLTSQIEEIQGLEEADID